MRNLGGEIAGSDGRDGGDGGDQSWHNFRCPLISPLSVDPLINGTALIFHCGNVSLTEECLFLNLFMALALIILFCQIFQNLTLSTL